MISAGKDSGEASKLINIIAKVAQYFGFTKLCQKSNFRALSICLKLTILQLRLIKHLSERSVDNT